MLASLQLQRKIRESVTAIIAAQTAWRLIRPGQVDGMNGDGERQPGTKVMHGSGILTF